MKLKLLLLLICLVGQVSGLAANKNRSDIVIFLSWDESHITKAARPAGAKKSTTTRMIPAAMAPDSGVRAPPPSLTSDCDMPPLTGKSRPNPTARLDAASARNSWLAFSRPPCFAAKVRPMAAVSTAPAENRRTSGNNSFKSAQAKMTSVLREMHPLLLPGGHAAFEVGEVRKGKMKLEDLVLTCGVAVGLEPVLVAINDQKFTKTSNCWGVSNYTCGTNSNRIVVFRKPA